MLPCHRYNVGREIFSVWQMSAIGIRLGAHTVQVKVRYGDFTTLTRQFTVEEPLTEAGEIYRLACWLLGRERLVSRPLRLLGLTITHPNDPEMIGVPVHPEFELLDSVLRFRIWRRIRFHRHVEFMFDVHGLPTS